MKAAVATNSTLALDEAFVQDLKLKVDAAVNDTVITTKIVDGWLNPNEYGSNLSVYADFPLQYALLEPPRRNALTP